MGLRERLVQAVVPGQNGGTTTFRYDPFGRRIQKSGPLGTTNYLYDGEDSIEELDQSGNVLARYTHGEGLDEAFAEFHSGTSSYYEADGLNSIMSLTNSSATIISTYSYDSFGHLSNTTGTLLNSLRYTGREFDSETGLSYYRARYYDSAAGRFMSEDPAAFSASLNFYSYVRNSPVMWVDPFGLEEGSASNLHKRNNIDSLARSYDGSTTWNFYKRKAPFPANSNKCNLFVYDVTTEGGAEPRVPGRPKWPMPTASEWANPKVKIPNWRMLGDGETPQPGDVAAYNLDPDPRAWAAPYTGHSGIIVSGPGGCNCINSESAHDNNVGSSSTQFISDPTPHPIHYRRFTGD
jgi:RHS repeat-associated protein